MISGLDAMQKGKKSEQKRGKGEGAMRKKVTFSMGRARKSGGITPTLRVSSIPLYPSRTFPIFVQS